MIDLRRGKHAKRANLVRAMTALALCGCGTTAAEGDEPTTADDASATASGQPTATPAVGGPLGTDVGESAAGGGAGAPTSGPPEVPIAPPVTASTSEDTPAPDPSAAGGSGGETANPASGGESAGGAAAAGDGSADAGASGAEGSSGAEGTAGAAAGAPSEPEPAVSCTASNLESGNSNRTVDVGGTSRSYVLHVPASYDGTTAVPLVLDFHGLGGSGSQQQGSSGYQAVSDREGFLIAFPDGIDNAWNIGPCCTNSQDVDDLGFAAAIIDSLATDGCVDLNRVYATGFSMGGGMSHFLACNAADRFAAVAPAAFDLITATEQECAPSRPISVLSHRGTNDTVVPYEGGPGGSGRVTFLGAQQTLERWAEIDGCTGSPTTDGDCTLYESCSDGVEVGLCVAQNGGHAPGNADVGWAFLSRFSLP